MSGSETMTFADVIKEMHRCIRDDENAQPCFAREVWEDDHSISHDGKGYIWYKYGPYSSNKVIYIAKSEDLLATDWREI